MFLKRCNDWLKVFVVYLIVGVLYCIESLFAEKFSAATNMYVLTACVILMEIYYIFAGIFMKDVKAYKIVSVYVITLVIACIIQGWIGAVLVGGANFLSNFLDSFLEIGWQENFEEVASYVLFSIIASALIPLMTVLLGKWIGMRKGKKTRTDE